jgi:putative SOS response-associated peptidase YedK
MLSSGKEISMCTRITQVSNPLELAEAHELDSIVPFQPGYNIAPFTPILAILRHPERDARIGLTLQWGLTRLSADPRYLQKRHIYARAETALSRLSFHGGVKHHRCVVPVNGYYEWRETGYGKRPYYIQAVNRKPFLIAAIWERCVSPQRALIESCALLTTKANRDVAQIHDRMPLILSDAAAAQWLDPELNDPEQLGRLLRPCPEHFLSAHPVSEAVNLLESQGPELIAPLAPEPRADVRREIPQRTSLAAALRARTRGSLAEVALAKTANG